MIRITVLTLTFGLSLAQAAEEVPAGETVDFSPGFQRLVALGLPSLDGAEWVAAGESQSMDDYELQEIVGNLKGSGWKLQLQGKPAFLPLGMLDTREMPASNGGRGLLGTLFGGGAKSKKTVDPVKDATTLTATLEDPEKSKNLRNVLEYRGSASLGRLLIFAAQLHQTGHPHEANRLAASVFALGANPESVIDAAINRLAARDLSRVTDAFFKSKDWAAYERELRALVERYPRGWETYPAIQMMLPAVAKRAAGGMPAKPSIDGITLNPEAIAALDDALQDAKGGPDEDAITRYAKENGIPERALTPQLREQIAQMMSRGDGGSSGGPWLIEKSSNAESKDPWSRLKRLGLDALPALAAVASDETLTLSRNASSNRSYSFSSNRQSAEELALTAYNSMDRPLTRGELACRMLASTLPGEDRDVGNPQALADAAIEFWKAQRGKSKLDLLLVFLAEGDSSQKRTASTALAEMPDEAAHQAFEKYVLEGDDLTSSLDSVATYLKLRKAAAKDFFVRFSATLKTQLEGVDLDQVSVGYEIKRAGGVDKYLKKLSLFVGGESPRKMVLELAKAEKPDVPQIQSLATTVAESSPETFVPLYLEAAVIATHAETRAAFITALSRHAYYQRSNKGEDLKETPVPSAQIPNWTTLLGDERPIANGTRIQSITAGALEQFHSSVSQEQVMGIYQVAPFACDKLILARANARVEGKTPVPLPDGDKVSPTRLEEMLKQLADAKPEAVHSLANAWKIEEKLAFQKWRADSENSTKTPASVIASRKLLTGPIETIGGPPVAQTTEIMRALKLEPGTKIDFDSLTKLAATLASEAKTHSGLCLGFAETPLATGMAFMAERAFAGNSSSNNGYSRHFLSQSESALEASETTAAVTVNYSHKGRWVQVGWTHDGTKVIPPDAASLDTFREAMAAGEQPDADPGPIFVVVLHRDDLEKLEKLMNSDDSETSDE